MIQPAKHANALRALHHVLIWARFRAYGGGASPEVAEILDTAEYLVCLLASPREETAAFRGHLADLAARFPDLRSARDAFETVDSPQW